MDKIIIISFDESRINALKEKLIKWGMANEIIEAYNLEDAHKYFKCDNQPVLAFIDSEYPDGKSFSFLSQIRGDPCCLDMPIFIFSKQSNEDLWMNSYTAGANGLVTYDTEYPAFTQKILNAGLKWRITDGLAKDT